MEAANPVFLLISSASAAAFMGAVFSYAKTASEQKTRVLELENDKLEQLREIIIRFIASADLYFEHAVQEFENAEEVDVTDDYDKLPGIVIRYYKKTFMIDKAVLNELWMSYNTVRVRLATFGSDEALDQIDKAIALARTLKNGDAIIRRQVQSFDFNNIKGNFFQRCFLYILYLQPSTLISGVDVGILKINWEETCKMLLKSLKPTFAKIETRLATNSRIPDKLEKVSILCMRIFVVILLAELAIYIMDYIPRFVLSIGSLFRFLINHRASVPDTGGIGGYNNPN